MAYFLLMYDVVDGFVDRRLAHREEHLGLVRAAQARGEFVMGGVVNEPSDLAMLLFQGADGSAAEGFAKSDPYVREGLVTRWRVRPWAVALGGPP